MTEAPEMRGRRAQLSALRLSLRRVWKIYERIFRTFTSILFGAVFLILAIFFVNYVVLSTPKDQAYRNLDPSLPLCQAGSAKGWTILADTGREALKTAAMVDDDGWADSSNSEDAAIARDGLWRNRLRCALQHHLIPATAPGAKPLDYTLGFLEFQENSEPYALTSTSAGGDIAIDSKMLRHAMESTMHERHVASITAVKPIITQLDALKEHLATGSNYVIVFAHGWRHDARIGDQNVADLRLYAAHAARFLAQRCPIDPTVCDMKVTGIFIGWRGARVDELGLKETFGESVGGLLGGLSAGATLFDRKPVSEQVAPGAISALRGLEGVLAPKAGGHDDRHNKMIVFGHSLGGNMLATGLEDDVLKLVKRHKFGETLPPVLGDLVVLLNPAAEAAKWTAIQREVWSRTAFHTDQNTAMADIVREHGLFPPDQKPVMVSVTAALRFPAGGLRPGDCEWIGLDIDDSFKSARENIRARLARSDAMFDDGTDYDWATHDLFPTFKLDFRPAAAYFDRVAARIEGRQPSGETCASSAKVGWLASLRSLPARALATLMATFPFQNSSQEQSHTIGNLDPPRPAAGLLADSQTSAAPFGTTHELLGRYEAGSEKHNPYATLADAPIDCPVSNHWLTRARTKQRERYGTLWNSADLAPASPGAIGEGEPAARFVHGFELSGTAPITRANDPFWNMRAFDNALSRHDGYRLTSFICAMNQLVMDDIAGSPHVMTNQMIDPTQPTLP